VSLIASNFSGVIFVIVGLSIAFLSQLIVLIIIIKNIKLKDNLFLFILRFFWSKVSANVRGLPQGWDFIIVRPATEAD
jgi:hypothetical protein